MKESILGLLTMLAFSAYCQPLGKRVVHNHPAVYRQLSAVHAGAGQMRFAELIGRQALASNFLYLHAGEILDKGGIGQHFHHSIEEMYAILDGEAEFTINGRTAKIKGPAVVPCKMGDAHGIYNGSGKPLRWLNFAVSSTKGRGDNFDLGDDRVGAPLDKVPQFVWSPLNREALRANSPAYTGSGVLYRRLLSPDVFSTTWNHVDHLIVPAGSTAERRQPESVEEVFYVIKGAGRISNSADSAFVAADDAFFSSLGETLTIRNQRKDDLEFLVVGVAPAKGRTITAATPGKPKAIVLQMDFVVAKENAEAFEKMYSSVYVPAMKVQQGYLGSTFLRLFPESISKEIQAEPTVYNYQIQISFVTEEARRKWVASPQHQIAWPAASGLAKEYKWRGYDVLGDDRQ